MRLLLLAAAWIGGVCLGLEADFRPAAIYVLLAACLTLGLCLFLLRWRLFPVAVAALLLLGLWRADSIEFPAQPLTTADQQQVLVTGIIAADPGATSRQVRFELEVSAIDRGDGTEEASGRLLVYAAPPAELAARRPSPHFRYGDVMTIQGTLQRPQPIDGFNYPKYLAARGIGGILFASEVEAQGEAGNGWREGIYDLRRRLSETLEAALPSPSVVPIPSPAAGTTRLVASRVGRPVPRHRRIPSSRHIRAPRRGVDGSRPWRIGPPLGTTAAYVPDRSADRHLGLCGGGRGFSIGAPGGGDGDGLPGRPGSRPPQQHIAGLGAGRHRDDRSLSRTVATGRLSTQFRSGGGDIPRPLLLLGLPAGPRRERVAVAAAPVAGAGRRIRRRGRRHLASGGLLLR